MSAAVKEMPIIPANENIFREFAEVVWENKAHER